MLPEKRQRLDPSSSPLHPNCSSFNSNNPPSSSLSDLRGRFSVQAVDSPTSSPPYFTAPTQPQKQSQNYSTSSKNPSNSRQSSQDATVISENGSRPNHGFPKANMRPLTSFNAPSPPTPSTSQSLPETTQSLPLPSQTQSNLTDAQREKIKASKEAALARVSLIPPFSSILPSLILSSNYRGMPKASQSSKLSYKLREIRSRSSKNVPKHVDN